MEEIGKIIELIGNKAKIEIATSSTCGHCGQKSVCHSFGENKKIIELNNDINAQVDDWVKIDIKGKNQVLSILLVLGLPILLFLIGVFIGYYISGDKLAAILGGAGLLLAFTILKLINNYLISTNKSLASIKEKVNPELK